MLGNQAVEAQYFGLAYLFRKVIEEQLEPALEKSKLAVLAKINKHIFSLVRLDQISLVNGLNERFFLPFMFFQ